MEEVVFFMLEKGADAYQAGKDGIMPLSTAAVGGHKNVVRVLMVGVSLGHESTK